MSLCRHVHGKLCSSAGCYFGFFACSACKCRLHHQLEQYVNHIQTLPRALIKQLNKKEAGLYKSMFKALGKGPAEPAAPPPAAAAGDQAAPMDAAPVEAAA